jgi:glucose/arabinose dehydrogenase
MRRQTMYWSVWLCLVALAGEVWLGGHEALADEASGVGTPELPVPFSTPVISLLPRIVPWPEGKTPKAPAGFRVNQFAALDMPRWIFILPNGDALVTQSNSNPEVSPNRMTLLRDTDGDGEVDVQQVVANDLRQPLGMALLGETFYLGVTDAVLVTPLADLLAGKPKFTKILALPTGGFTNHWTRNLLLSRDGKKLYVTVGSGTDVGEQGIEHERLRADILEMNPDGSGMRVFASGMRNPVGLAWEPVSGKLWTAVNERNNLGDNLVPDYITSVQEGGFYGWPYSYFGPHKDPRVTAQRPDLVAKAIVPDMALGAHTASLGLAFCEGERFPEKYRGGAFVGQHGSTNRSQFVGYQVAFVPFSAGMPAGSVEEFLTGFIADGSRHDVYGRPVGVTMARDGTLLVADDAGGRIWRVVPDDDAPVSDQVR